jgi:hypothetical protein
MQLLPSLKSGRAAQYPVRRTVRVGVDTITFMDGEEQRCATTSPLHEWTIQFGLLDEQELRALQVFVAQEQGPAGSFEFTDPVDGVRYGNCSLKLETLSEWFEAPGRMRAQIVIRENPN